MALGPSRRPQQLEILRLLLDAEFERVTGELREQVVRVHLRHDRLSEPALFHLVSQLESCHAESHEVAPLRGALESCARWTESR